MMKVKLFSAFTAFIFLMSFVCVSPALAKDTSTAELKKQIEALQKRVEELESEKKQTNTGNAVMPPQRRERGWNSFDEIYRMQEEMNQLFQHSLKTRGNLNNGLFSNNMSYDDNFEIKDQKDKYVLEIDMKGMNEDKTNIEITERYITVRGEQSTEKKQEDNGSYISSKSFSSFMRTIPLPADADTSNVKSDKKGDKLIITFGKKK